MKRSLFAVIALSMVSALSFADKGKGHDKGGKDEGFRLIHSADLKASMTKTPKAKVFDANTADVRQTEGKIEGAHLLSSSGSYDIAKELPKDKGSELVFYCYNEQCMASHRAAKRAVQAGYTDVAVLTDGIVGWKKAGGNVEKIR